jgi:4-diphosphocytidyl-2-C-methyl-D-erythritol kinase
LLGLDQLHDNQLDAERLHEIAAELGSDIPFFLKPGAARCTGRGEIIQSVPSPAPQRVLLLKPNFGVSTPDAYGRWSGSKELPGVPYAAQEIDRVTLINDLERPVFGKHRFLAEMKQWLLMRDECAAALLAGSGSTLFAVLRDGADADELARSARHELDPGLWHWVGSTGA